MSEHTAISPQSQVTSAAAIKEVVSVPEPLKQDGYKENFQRLPIQRKLSVGAVDDSLELEADTTADKIMRMPEQNFMQRKCAHCEEEKLQRKPLASFIQKKELTNNNVVASDSVSSQIQSGKGGGNSMNESTKSFMESRFRTDFSDVRIHSNNNAAELSNQLSAQAFTVGNDIYFNEGKYQPESEQGKHLLAHELTHVIQQSGNGFISTVIQRKPAGKEKTKNKYYQEVIDKYKKFTLGQKSYTSGYISYAAHAAALEDLISLCEKADNGNAAEIDTALYSFIGSLNDSPAPLYEISMDIFEELSIRLLKLGLTKQSVDLRNSFVSTQGSFVAETREIPFLEGMLKRAVNITGIRTPQQMRTALVVMIEVFIPLSKRMASIGPEESERKGLQQDMSILIGAFETVFQSLIDYAADQFANNSGKGPGILEMASDVLENHLKPALYSNEAPGIDNLKLDSTRTIIFKGRKGAGILKDSFATGEEAKRRQLDVFAYSPDAERVDELQSSLDQLYKTRIDQITVIKRIYGVNKFEPFSNDRNAEAIENMPGGKFHLDSDEDWRQFVLSKYKFMTSQGRRLRGNQDILETIMELLFAYLKAFTQHAHHVNIYDIGKTNYLNRKFPRSLEGRLLYDCGVYAVKVAYILSLVRNELGLRFRFVSLPVHIALLIEGDNLPTFIIQNNSYREITQEDMNSLRVPWDEVAVKDTFKNKNQENDQFIGEVVSQDYIPAVSMPFRFDNVPTATGKAGKDQASLWANYQKIAARDIFDKSIRDTKSDNYLFDLNYLGFSKEYRDIHNDYLLSYWNVDAPAAWKKFTDVLKAKADKSDRITPANALAPLKEFKKENDSKSKDVLDGLKNLQLRKDAVSTALNNTKSLAQKDVYTANQERVIVIDEQIEPVQAFAGRVDDEINILTELDKNKSAPILIGDIINAILPFFSRKIKPIE